MGEMAAANHQWLKASIRAQAVMLAALNKQAAGSHQQAWIRAAHLSVRVNTPRAARWRHTGMRARALRYRGIKAASYSAAA